MDLFTDPWARAWGERLNESAPYRAAAQRWEGAVLLEELGPDGEVHGAVFLDLLHGRCLESRVAAAGDEDRAAYVICATRPNWEAVLSGMAPISALLRGKLRLRKGGLASLVPFTAAASELVAAARGIDAGDLREGPGAGPEEPATRRLDFDSEPWHLWEKAKRLGAWNPSDIDFSNDARDWSGLKADEQDLLLRLGALFQAGEEAVTIDLLPLIAVIAEEGRLEEEIYLTSFLWEEAKHVEVFTRFFDAVGARGADLDRYRTPSYDLIFSEALPAAMEALKTDRSPQAQARASVTYNLIVEGVLAETGYDAYHRILADQGILPSMQQVAVLLKQDESRHLAYGVHLLTRLVKEHGDPVWRVIESEMDALLEPAVGIIEEAFAAYDPEAIPFGLTPAHFVEFAQTQFEKRLGHIERAREG
jgi:ribonucleoside-diphosphate reductase beta chain